MVMLDKAKLVPCPCHTMKAYEGHRSKVPRNLDPGTILRPRNEVPQMVRMMTLPLPRRMPASSQLLSVGKVNTTNSRVNITFRLPKWNMGRYTRGRSVTSRGRSMGFSPRPHYKLIYLNTVGRVLWHHPRVEAGSNTSTVILRVVGGDEKGSLKSEIVKYGLKSQGTRTRERLRWQRPAAHTKDRPDLLSERAPHKNKTVTVTQVKMIWSRAPDGARYQDLLTDWPSVAMWLWLWLDYDTIKLVLE
jgi:hypothetical protein